MAARDIEYVELYADDRQVAVDYFVDSMGFTPIAESEDRASNSTLLRQGAVSIVVTSGPATEEFIEEHGNGFADIALACDDVEETRAGALAVGARPLGNVGGNPVVSAFGDVRHTLLPVASRGADRLPPGRDWHRRSDVSRPGRIRLLDHVAVCLEAGTLADYTDSYVEGFGLERYSAEYVAFGDQAMDSVVVRSASGGITYTLIEPDKKKHAGQIDAFLDRNSGPGVQHLAFLVDEIVPAVHEFRASGVGFLATTGTYYDMLVERFPEMRDEIADLRAAHVLADRDEWGYLLQLFTRSPYERNTLFYELIQRRGSRGFGSANIKALYEAVERDRVAAE
jgi:4-hydroxymandelate synthase